ncbi:MAG: 50S ribosomal protein L11 methyltransferase [Alphaproteobacteria bacterium]|nr:50S ribosomal protein L11 methyltransferase [Alphaproteobacteria bacterium]
MAWVALDIVGLRRSATDGASAALFALGAVGVQESWLPGTAPAPRQPWDTGPYPPLPARHVLTAWFEHEDRPAAIRALGPWLDADTTLVWRTEEEKDWEAESRAGFTPIAAGGFVVAPPWDAPEGAILVEPGAGFGTGDHPTTRQALVLLDGLTGRTALDIGCGSGVLALAAASRGFEAHGIDIDEAAVANAVHNAALNGLPATFDTRTPDALAPADVVLANLHAELIVRFADDLMRLTRHHLVLAGILADREPLVRAAIPWPVAQRLVDGEWIALELRPA